MANRVTVLGNKVNVKVDYNESTTVGDLIKDHFKHEANTPDYKEDLEVYIEESDEELSKSQLICELKLKDDSKLFFCRCKKIDVTVLYNGNKYEHHFKPFDKVKAVLAKAVHHFKINDVDATGMNLYSDSSATEKLSEGEYLVRILKDDKCSITLYLSKDANYLG